MVYLLEELKELKKIVGLKKVGDSAKKLWGCEQCLSNPTVWKESTGNQNNFEASS
jgi:hypothetical protein